MRWLGWLLILAGIASLAVVFWVAEPLGGTVSESCHRAAGVQPSPAPSKECTWRRTAAGWQRARWLNRPVEYRRPALHPLVVGLLLAFLVLTAMALLSPERRNRGQESGHTG